MEITPRIMKSLFALLVIGFLSTGLLTASPVAWVDWTSGTTGLNGSAVGVLHFGTTDVTVSYSGEIWGIQTNGGTNYWTQPNPSYLPYTSSLVDNAPPASDIIELAYTTTKTLTFSQPIDNLVFAVISLNANGYVFNQDFNIISYGCGYWGCGSLVKDTSIAGQYTLEAGTALSPAPQGPIEPHGLIEFDGPVTSITWTSLISENWNGFTVGALEAAPESTPEPGTVGLLLLGTAILPIVKLRQRS
jgi:hypothetical protein